MNAAAGGAPVPNGKIERSEGGGTEIADLLTVDDGVCGELRGVNAVEVVEGERREIFSAGSGEAAAGEVKRFESGAEVGIVARGEMLDLVESGERCGGSEVFGEDVVVLKIGKDENREVEARVEERELRFLKLAAAILGLQFGLDGVGVGDFATVLKLLGELKKAVTFGGGALRGFQFVLRGENGEVALHDGDDQAARGDFGFGASDGRGSRNFAIRGDGRNINGFVDVALADVFVDGVVGDVANATNLIGLGVEELIVVGELGEQSVAGLGAVFVGGGGFGESGLIDGAIGAGQGEGLRKRNLDGFAGCWCLRRGTSRSGRLRLRGFRLVLRVNRVAKKQR